MTLSIQVDEHGVGVVVVGNEPILWDRNVGTTLGVRYYDLNVGAILVIDDLVYIVGCKHIHIKKEHEGCGAVSYGTD